MNLGKLDWIDIVGVAVADALGPIGAPLKAVLRIRSDLRKQAISVLDSAIASKSIDIEPAFARTLNLPDDGILPLQFAITILHSWKANGNGMDPAQYVDYLASQIWTNEASYRRGLAELVFEPDEIRLVIRDSQADLTRIRLNGTAEAVWYSLFDYLRGQDRGRVLYTLYILSLRHPAHTWLRPWVKG